MNIDEYIKQAPAQTQSLLNELRDLIRKTAPDAEETLSYAMPTYKLHGNLVHFAAYEKHIGFYPTPSAILYFADALKTYRTSKGAIQFPLNEKLPKKLIESIVRFRIEENMQKAESKKTGKAK